MAYLHLYKNNPTAGWTDGTLVSEGTGTAPIVIALNAANNEESAAVKLAIRCETGYITAADTVIIPGGTNAAKWALSADGVTFGAYGASLTIASGIGATNTLFWVKAKAVDTETPANDTGVTLGVACATINAV